MVRGPAIIGGHPDLGLVHRSLHGDRPRRGDHRLEVEHSIVLAGSSIRDLHARMEASLLGKNVRLSRSEGMPKTLRFLVGDNADISIP